MSKRESITDQVQAILADTRAGDAELRRKLRYCQEQIALGRDAGLMARRRELVREALRRTS